MKEQLLKVAGGFLALGMVAASSANAGGLVIAEFELGDHPDGSAALPYYGLRLDNILAPGVVTLSMDHHNNTRMTVIEDNGVLSMHITGTLYGGEISGNAYVDAQSYEVDFTYALNVSDAGNGWEVNGFDAGNTGTLTNLDTQAVTDLYSKENGAGLVFAMLADGHRLSGDSSSWVGRGWLTTNDDGSMPASGSQDWLFTANKVPAPSGIAVLGLGGMIATRRRR
tara:strand:+ start:1571 stop:2245 length:675 start_codon:yes stop_codon:yes gene_type:complete